jgi:predicted DNA-binding protein
VNPTVNFKELLEGWRASAAAPRTAQTYAVRLPLEDAARLAALAEMFPGREPGQLISELLSVALQEVAAAMPYVAGKRVISTDEQGDPVYEDVGPTPRFMQLSREYRQKLHTALPPRKKSAARSKKAPRRAK